MTTDKKQVIFYDNCKHSFVNFPRYIREAISMKQTGVFCIIYLEKKMLQK